MDILADIVDKFNGDKAASDVMLISVLAIILVSVVLWAILHSPFRYPYFIHRFDVSGKRNPSIEDLLDNFIIEGNFQQMQEHAQKIKAWKEECRRKIDKSIMKKYRNAQFQKCLNDNNAFRFKLIRMQTRYRQRNYVRVGYKVPQEVSQFSCSYAYLLERKEQLEAIDYEMPLRAYHSKNQRKLMTKELRNKVMLRDNYTCQICGKYMPDEVGLQIDHIIPVSKGGKTILSNLQVTCSKCNNRKRDKMM